MKLNVYGKLLQIERENGEWAIFVLGEGKRRRANDFAIPSHVAESELIGYLEDILHEAATPENPAIKPLD